MAFVCSKPEQEIQAQSTACGKKSGQSCAGHNAPSNPPWLRASFSLLFLPSSMSTKWHVIYKYSPEALVPFQPSPNRSQTCNKEGYPGKEKNHANNTCTRTWATHSAEHRQQELETDYPELIFSNHLLNPEQKSTCGEVWNLLFPQHPSLMRWWTTWAWLATLVQRKEAFQLASCLCDRTSQCCWTSTSTDIASKTNLNEHQ